MAHLNSYEKFSNEMRNIETNNTEMVPNLTQEQPLAPIAVIPQIQTVHVPPAQVGPNSTELTCPSCRCRIRTRVTYRSTTRTHRMCLTLSWTLCCCWLPYWMDSCRNANHTCPMCGSYIGTYAS